MDDQFDYAPIITAIGAAIFTMLLFRLVNRRIKINRDEAAARRVVGAFITFDAEHWQEVERFVTDYFGGTVIDRAECSMLCWFHVHSPEHVSMLFECLLNRLNKVTERVTLTTARVEPVGLKSIELMYQSQSIKDGQRRSAPLMVCNGDTLVRLLAETAAKFAESFEYAHLLPQLIPVHVGFDTSATLLENLKFGPKEERFPEKDTVAGSLWPSIQEYFHLK